MKLGFTYDCKDDYRAAGLSDEALAEFDSRATIDLIAETLTSLGFQVDAIGNLDALQRRLVNHERWELVFNICEGLHGRAREAAVPALLDAYRIPHVFSDALTMALTLDKAFSKRVVASCGVATAPFTLVRKESELQHITLPYPLFAKPVAEGSGKGVSPASFITTEKALQHTGAELLRRFAQPVLVETYLPGREFTVGILAGRCIGVAEITYGADTDSPFNSFHNKQLDLETYTLATDDEAKRAEETALAAWEALGGLDCGRIDLRSDAHGTPHFLEANALPGLTPGYSELPILAEQAGISYAQLLASIMESACVRHDLTMPEPAERKNV